MSEDPTQEGRAPWKISSIDRMCYTHFKVYGDLQTDTPPLVMLHGGPGSGHEYLLPFAAIWTRYGIPVVFYDHLGCAGSTHFREKAGDESFWQVGLFVTELKSLLSYLHIADRARGYYVLGHSWGGVVASTFASERPPGIRRLILLGPPASGKLFLKGAWELAEQLTPEAQKAIHEATARADFTSAAYMAAVDEFMQTFMIRACRKPPEMDMRSKHQAEDPTVRNAIVGRSPWLLDGLLGRIDLVPILAKINVPTLLMNGEFDTTQYIPTVPFFNHIPRIRWVTISRASHMLHLDSIENRDKVIRFVGEFLQQDEDAKQV